MRIWLLTSEYAHDHAGGIARYNLHYGRSLARMGHEVMLISGGKREEDRVLEKGLVLHVFQEKWRKPGKRSNKIPKSQQVAFPYNAVHYWIAYAWQMGATVASLVEERGAPDIIESQEYNGIPYYVLERRLQQAGFLEGTPVVLTLHSPDFLLQRINGYTGFELPAFMRGWMERQCMARADALTCPSHWLARRIREHIARDKRPIEIHRCPLDPHAQGQIRRQIVPGVRPRVLYVGRLEVRKGVFQLLEAADTLWREGLDFELCLAGADQPLAESGGTVWERLKSKYSGPLRAGRLRWLGNLNKEELDDIRARSHFQVLPSIWENFPYAAIEAMLAGCPLLASNSGGQAELLSGNLGGYLFDHDIPGDFTKALRYMLALSTAELEEIGREGSRRVKAFCDPVSCADARITLYEQLIAELPKRPQSYPFADDLPEGSDRKFVEDEEDGTTVIIPHYKDSIWIEAAVDSVLTSNEENLQVLVVDDGSDDAESLAALRRLEEREDAHIRVEYRPHMGLPATRNAGAKMASTKYIAFLDADDRFEPNFISRARYVLDTYREVDLVYSWVQYTGDSNEVCPAWDLSFPILLVQNQLVPACVMRRGAYLAMGGEDESMTQGLEDWEGWIRFHAQGGRGVCLSECLVRYNVRKDSMYRRMSQSTWLRVSEFIREKHRSLHTDWAEAVTLFLEVNGDPRGWHHPGMWTPWHLPRTRIQAARSRFLKLLRLGRAFSKRIVSKSRRRD